MILLIIVIYLCFVSLGLPDTLIGSAWSLIHVDLGVSLSFLGVITIIISIGTILSSLFLDKLANKLKTHTIILISILCTIVGLLGFSFSKSALIICLVSIPYGLGAGAIDASLNNYVANNFSSRHMHWLHCFWGVGTLISPFIMSGCLVNGFEWNSGFIIVSIVQSIICLLVLISFPLWKEKEKESEEVVNSNLTIIQKFKIPGAIYVLIAFFCYCVLEQTAMIWASTYFVEFRNVSEEIAAAFASLFCIGITLGRFIVGFISELLGDKKLIRIGSIIALVGIILLFLPFENDICSLIGFVVIGFGCAPIYPAIMHSTPTIFSKENSQALIGLQMAFAYMGCAFMPPLFGLIADFTTIGILPIFLIICWVLMFLMIEKGNDIVKKRNKNNI